MDEPNGMKKRGMLEAHEHHDVQTRVKMVDKRPGSCTALHATVCLILPVDIRRADTKSLLGRG